MTASQSMDDTSYPDSYYAATANVLPPFPRLQGPIEGEVCVIGGGLTGLSAALHLAREGLEVVLLEAQRVGWGASGRNGGQLGSGLRLSQDCLEGMFGEAKAQALWQLGEAAKALVKDLVARHAIACDLKPGVLYPLHRAREMGWARDYVRWLQDKYHYPHIRFIDDAELSHHLGTRLYYGGWLDTGAAHLHPLNLSLGLAQAAADVGVRIFEGTRALGRRGDDPIVVATPGGEVRCRAVVLGCNGYLESLEPRIMGKIMPINNYICATVPLGEELASSLIRDDVAVADSRFVVNYFRLSADKRLLFGGGETYTRRFPKRMKDFVRKHMLKVYPQLKEVPIDYAWGGTLAITLNRLPHVGRLAPNVYFAQGYSGHGLALAVLAGAVLAEAIAGRRERFELLASLPVPSFPGGPYLRWPGLVAGMFYYALRDRL
ncbi:MAG: NAD(P)/FAD-dependent oxidoreductase [Candidatus Competibacterales bacterium]